MSGETMENFDWKTKWQERTRGGSLIQRVGELPFPFPNGDCLLVELCRGAVYAVKGSGRYRGTVQSDLDLLPIPPNPEVVYWSKPEDVPLDAIRLRHKECPETNARGCHIEFVDSSGVIVINQNGCRFFINWSMMKTQLWLSGKTWEWNECTTPSEANR